MRKSTIVFFLGIVTFLFIGCSSSVLEDIEISDFKLIRATYNIYIERETNASTRKTIEVVFNDKNYHRMKLRGAEVTVNGISMIYDNNDLVRRYKTDEIPIEANKKYEFVVILANGEKAITTLTTDKIDFNELSFAPRLTQGVDYTISWATRGTSMGVKFWLYDTPDFSSLHEVLNEEINDNGSVTIEGSITESSKYPNITNSGFKLTRSGTSTVSDKFFSGTAAVYSSYFVEGIPVD
ncbi:MAG: hypothetical protein KAH07_07545 [Flavobacteriaceae bacterium]|nr:hypothetical protein [Flavobacteriaceae bacterium]